MDEGERGAGAGTGGEGCDGERAAGGAACAAGGGREAAAGGVRRAEDGAALPRGEGGQRRAARTGLPGGGQCAGHAGARAERGAHHRLGQPPSTRQPTTAPRRVGRAGGCLYARALPAQGTEPPGAAQDRAAVVRQTAG